MAFCSIALSASPYSASTSGVPPNVSVSIEVGAGREVLLVHPPDDVRAREDEVLVAAFQVRPAEVLGRQVLALDPGPRGAVEHEDTLGEDLLKGLGTLAL